MSGSPILQNGKLVGAVTHVLVNDPTRGYGILIENMLDGVRVPIPRKDPAQSACVGGRKAGPGEGLYRTVYAAIR